MRIIVEWPFSGGSFQRRNEAKSEWEKISKDLIVSLPTTN